MDPVNRTSNISNVSNTSTNNSAPSSSKSKEISDNNQTILRNIATDIWGNLVGPESEEKKGLGSWLWSWVPGSKATGTYVGKQLGTIHGADITKGTVKKIVENLLPSTTSRPGYWQTFKNFASGSVQLAITESATAAILPYATPIIVMAGGALGSVALETVTGVVAGLYNKMMKNPEKVKELQLQKFSPEILSQNATQLQELLDEEELKEITMLAIEYDIAFKLSQAKSEDIDRIFSEYAISRKEVSSDNKTTELKPVYRDGQKIVGGERNIIAEAKRILKTSNPGKRNEDIKAAIRLMAQHSITDKNDSSYYLIKCFDGKFCTPSGDVLPEEAVKNIQAAVIDKKVAYEATLEQVYNASLDDLEYNKYTKKESEELKRKQSINNATSTTTTSSSQDSSKVK